MPKKRKWRTRKTGTPNQVGSHFQVDKESHQSKRDALPTVSPIASRFGKSKKQVYTVSCMDENGKQIEFVTLASNEAQAEKKASKRGLLPSQVDSEEFEVIERPKDWKERIKKKLGLTDKSEDE